jgi:hypothetical protein
VIGKPRRERLRGEAAYDDLAVDQHAVAIEDDQHRPGPGRCAPAAGIRAEVKGCRDPRHSPWIEVPDAMSLPRLSTECMAAGGGTPIFSA